ncbi:type II secretion system F family protein [Candidatus Woesearchaeota archaeon]|nr:type II secretion system F family protein [Candidatus Woesearchaeota archaeon]MCF7900976.1 type II secretion system F family protein [Candidatus Woesearchaeota archaeon]MCF8013308.1 type II secretion system F family protein [Candidatus Woesearchaeota archaeon]
MSLSTAIAAKNPFLKKELIMAKIDKTPQEVIKQSLLFASYTTFGFCFLILLFLMKENPSILYILLIIVPVMFIGMYKFNMLKIKARILKRRKEIDRDVLFAGRYLLVKLNSGQPLINALVDASKSYGVANKYFKEIVKEIELGKPLENALEDESNNSPSHKFKKILFQISNALKIGIDVTEFLEATLNEIAQEQLIEINRYGKKLNSLTLFYMLFAIVMPSLGLTIIVIVLSMSGSNIDTNFFVSLLFLIVVIQVIFLSVYKSIRPNINI